MAEAANIQIKINTSEAEKAEKVLAALQNQSDKLYVALSNLDKGTSFDRLRAAAAGTETTFDRLRAANDGVATSFAGLDRQADAANDALIGVANTRAVATLDRTESSARQAGTSLALIDKANADIALRDVATSAGQADAAFDKMGVDRVTSDFGELSKSADKAEQELDQVSAAAKKADPAMDSVSRRGATLKSTFDSIYIAVAAASAAIGATVGVLVNLSDRYQSMNASLRIVTDSTEEFQTVQSALIQAARDTRSPLEDVAKLYAGMAPSLGEMGRAQEEVLRVTELVSKALKVGGGATEEHTAALQQFTQAMGSGVLRGDEFNSIMENGRGLALQLAEGLGVPVGALRAMAEEGELTADRVVDALLKQEAAIDGLFDDLPVTSGQAWTLVKNQALLSIGEIDKELGIAESWSGLLVKVAESMEGIFDGFLEAVRDAKDDWAEFRDDLNNSDATAYRVLRDIGEAIDAIGDALAPVVPYMDDFALALVAVGGGALAISALAGAFALLTSPVTLTVAAVAGLAVAVNEVYQNWDGVVAWWEGVMSDMADAVDNFAGAGSWDALANVADAAWSGIQRSFEIGFGMISGIAESGLQILRGDFVAGWATLVETANDFGDDIVLVLFDLLAVMKQSGTDLIVWMGQGITDGIAYAADAAKGVATGVADAFLNAGRGMFDAGADVAQGFIDGLIARVPGLESTLRFMGILPEEILRDETETQSPSRVTFRVGTDVAQGLADGLAAGMDSVGYAARQLAQHTESFFTDLYDATVRSIADADSIKDAFDGIGDFMEDWLRKYIAHFAANKIMVAMGLDSSSFESGFGGLISSVAGGLGGIVQSIGQSLGILKSGADSALGPINLLGEGASWLGTGASAALTPINMLGTSTAAAGESIGVLASDINGVGSAATGTSSVLGTLGTALGFGGLAYTLGELGGAANSAAMGVLTTIGSLVGGPLGAGLGAALGSAFGGSWQHIESGLQLAFKDGDLTGRSYEYFEKERSLWRGTATKIVYEELSGEIAQGLRDFMSGLGDTIVTLAEGLGIEGAEAIMSSFEVASANLDARAGDMEGQIDAYFNRVSLGAYRAIYDNLGPQMQAAIDDMINTTLGSTEQVIAQGGSVIESALNQMNADIANAMNDEQVAAAVEQWEATLGEVAIVIFDIVPLMEQMGISMGSTADEIQANTLELTQSFGGAGNTLALLTQLVTDFGGEGALAAMQLEAAQQRLDDWNESIGRGGDTLGMFTTTLDGLSGASLLAAETAGRFVTSIDDATGRISLNETGLRAWMEAIDQSTQFGAEAHASGMALLEMYRLQGEGAITTSEQMYEYAMGLDWATEAGLAAAQAAIEVGDALLIVEQEQLRLAGVLEDVNGIFQMLNVNVSNTTPLTAEAADALVELAGGMDAFRSATNQYYEEFYSEQERTRLELQMSTNAVQAWHQTLDPLTLQLAGITDGTVDTREEFRLLGDYLLSTGAAGHEAFVSMLNVQDSFLAVVDAGGDATAAITDVADTTSTGIDAMVQTWRSGLESVVLDAGLSGSAMEQTLLSSFEDMVTNATFTGSEMDRSLALAFQSVLNNAGIAADQLPEELRTGLDALVGAASTASDDLGTTADAVNTDLDGLSGGINDMGDAATGAADDSQRSATEVAREMGLAADHMADAASLMEYTLGRSAASLESTLNSVAGDINRATVGIGSSLYSVRTSLSSTGSYSSSAASSISTLSSRISSLASAANSAANRLASASSTVNGSHATGLDYVPFDGYVAELHKGEMVLPADVSDWLRNNGVQTPTVAVNAPAVSSVQNRDDGSREALEAIRQELAELNRRTEDIGRGASSERGSIAGINQQQRQAIEQLQRDNDRLSRKIAAALS